MCSLRQREVGEDNRNERATWRRNEHNKFVCSRSPLLLPCGLHDNTAKNQGIHFWAFILACTTVTLSRMLLEQ